MTIPPIAPHPHQAQLDQLKTEQENLSKVQRVVKKIFSLSKVVLCVSVAAFLFSAAVCPPLGIPLLAITLISFAIFGISGGANSAIKTAIKYKGVKAQRIHEGNTDYGKLDFIKEKAIKTFKDLSKIGPLGWFLLGSGLLCGISIMAPAFAPIGVALVALAASAPIFILMFLLAAS